MPAMARYFAEFADAQLFAQFAMTAPAVLLILGAPLAGFLATIWGRRRLMLVSLALYVIGGAGVLLIDRAEYLVALRLTLGLAGGGLLTTSLALIGEHYAGNARERILGYATSLSSLMAGLALISGGNLVDGFGWRAPFSLYLLGVPLLILAMRILPASDDIAPEPPAQNTPGLSSLAHVWPYYALLVLLTLGMFTPSIQVPFFLDQQGVTSAATQSSIVAATSFVAILSAGAYGWIRRWIGTHGVLTIDALSMGLGIVLVAQSSSQWGSLIGCAMVGVGAGMSEPAIASLVFRRTPPWVHGVAMGLIVSALNIGQFVNPVAFGPLRMVTTLGGALTIVGTTLTVTGILIALRNRSDLTESHAPESEAG